MSCVVTRLHSDWNYVSHADTKTVKMRIHAERFREGNCARRKTPYILAFLLSSAIKLVVSLSLPPPRRFNTESSLYGECHRYR